MVSHFICVWKKATCVKWLQNVAMGQYTVPPVKIPLPTKIEYTGLPQNGTIGCDPQPNASFKEPALFFGGVPLYLAVEQKCHMLQLVKQNWPSFDSALFKGLG